MFPLFGRKQKNKELEEIMERIRMNVSNNYKDAAQLNLTEFENRLNALKESGALDDTQQAHYGDILQDLKAQMKNFTHKDQKPYWV